MNYLTSIPVSMLLFFLDAAVFKLMWNWFTPALHMPWISFKTALGLSILTNFVQLSPAKRSMDATSFKNYLFRFAFLVLFAWAVASVQ